MTTKGHLLVAISGALACAPATPSAAPVSAPIRFLATDTVSVDTVAPGIMHYRVRRPTGPFNVQIVTVPIGAANSTANRSLPPPPSIRNPTQVVT